jgi:hypothetical protein
MLRRHFVVVVFQTTEYGRKGWDNLEAATRSPNRLSTAEVLMNEESVGVASQLQVDVRDAINDTFSVQLGCAKPTRIVPMQAISQPMPCEAHLQTRKAGVVSRGRKRGRSGRTSLGGCFATGPA